MKKYKNVRIPLDAWEGFYKKKLGMENMLKTDLGRNTKINFTDVMKFFSQKQTVVFPDELAKYLNSNRKGRKRFYSL